MKLEISNTLKQNVSPEVLLELFLLIRGISDRDGFLQPKPPSKIDFSNFFPKKKYDQELKKSLKLLKEAQKSGRTVVVYTDYDADGLSGGAILWQALHNLGINVMPYVPDRRKEGYGFSIAGIDFIKKQYDPALIISVDHGILGHEPIVYAGKLGIPIIVTDHHQRGEVDPKALGIFHTDQLSGSGVAYFFAREIVSQLESNNKSANLSPFNSDYLALASIGTIADLVPLVGASRSITKSGLQAFSKLSNPGLMELTAISGVGGKALSTYEVGFMIAPRINAFGRLGDPTDALRLLCTPKFSRARELSKSANLLNKQRQELTEATLAQARQKVDKDQKLIIVVGEDWNEGLIGLVASKLVHDFHKPAVVITKGGRTARGSARSIEGFDITEFLRREKKYFDSLGGHSGAAGFSINSSKIDPLVKELLKRADDQIDENLLTPRLKIDFEIGPDLLTLDHVLELQKIAPTGMGNREPVFYTKTKVKSTQLMGRDNKHIKIFDHSTAPNNIEYVYFYGAAESESLELGQEIGIAFTPEINSWNGKTSLSGKVKTIFT